MAQQLEFDLVSPFLAGSTPIERRLLEEAGELMELSAEKVRLARVAAQLNQQDLILDPKPSNELEQLQILLGPEAWKKSRRRWERRQKLNLIAVRKVIIGLRSLTEKANH